jgi:Trypsin-like peptidase domain
MANADHSSVQELYLRYGCCMAYIAVERDGDENIGSAFHVGDGVFVTARHVVDGQRIREMRLTDVDLFYKSDLFPKESDGTCQVTKDSHRICDDIRGQVTIIGGPWFHPNPDIDVAAIRVSGMAPGAHCVPLGGHLDDWVGTGQFELSEALVLGYPPIPFTREPVLIAAGCQINAVVDLDIGPRRQMHFILSAVPRGGFSGGLALSEWGFALGVITQSLLTRAGPPELGYFTTTSIEAVYECLSHHHVLPDVQKASWDGLWDMAPVRARRDIVARVPTSRARPQARSISPTASSI